MAAGASAVLVVMGAGVAGVAAMVGGGGGQPGPRIVTEVNQAAPAAPVPVEKPRVDRPRPMPKNREKAVGHKVFVLEFCLIDSKLLQMNQFCYNCSKISGFL